MGFFIVVDFLALLVGMGFAIVQGIKRNELAKRLMPSHERTPGSGERPVGRAIAIAVAR
jgi:hypothetical protein